MLNREQRLPNGDTVDAGHTRSQTYAFLANYGATNKVMVSASPLYIITRYWDPPSHVGQPGYEVIAPADGCRG